MSDQQCPTCGNFVFQYPHVCTSIFCRTLFYLHRVIVQSDFNGLKGIKALRSALIKLDRDIRDSAFEISSFEGSQREKQVVTVGLPPEVILAEELQSGYEVLKEVARLYNDYVSPEKDMERYHRLVSHLGQAKDSAYMALSLCPFCRSSETSLGNCHHRWHFAKGFRA